MENKNLITVKELCKILRYAPQTIYNKINKKVFSEKKHYIRINRKKILFIWPAIAKLYDLEKLNANSEHASIAEEKVTNTQMNQEKKQIESAINI